MKSRGKKKYKVPKIEKILLDKNISIQMQSTPPPDPFYIKKKDSGDANPFQ